MAAMLQTRHAPAPDTVALAAEFALARGRAHEIAGSARQAMALMIAARMTGPVLWLQPGWVNERLMGDGVTGFLDPGRLIFGTARTAPELLWAAEEALRTGLVPLVAADLPAPPGLTPVRRLHLAAEAGAERGVAPLMLLLTPGAGGAPGVETRWTAAPAPGWALGGGPRWRLARSRARMAPAAAWEMRLSGGGILLDPLREPDTARPGLA